MTLLFCCVLTITDLDPGTVVVTNKNYNAYLEEEHRVVSIMYVYVVAISNCILL